MTKEKTYRYEMTNSKTNDSERFSEQQGDNHENVLKIQIKNPFHIKI